MKVYTYYDDILENQKELLNIWQKNWKDCGFEPVVLSESNAKSHPYYDEFVANLKSIHLKVLSVPLSPYGLACYLRWLTYASLNIDQPFYVMDYDIINNGVEVSQLNPIPEKLTLHAFCCPCFVSANSKQFNDLCHKFVDISQNNIEKNQQFARKRNFGKFYHDNEFFIYHKDLLDGEYIYKSPELVVNFDLGSNMSDKLVHVSHSSLKRTLDAQPKYQYRGDMRTHIIKHELNIQ